MSKSSIEAQGTVQSFNISPGGSYEGLLLKTSREVLQMNFPPALSSSIALLIVEGSRIKVDAEPSESKARSFHPVFQLLALTAAGGKKLSVPEKHARDNDKFSGKIHRLNYSLGGEINGGILANGDFLHVKPHGAAALNLKVEMKVEGRAKSKLMADGHCVLEATEVNGVQIEKKPKQKKKAAH